MAEPIRKTENINGFLDKLSNIAFSRERANSIVTDVCVRCGKEARIFMDKLSKKDFSITGLCQECQDFVYSDAYEDDKN